MQNPSADHILPLNFSENLNMNVMKSSNFQNDINDDGDLDKNEMLNFNNFDDPDV